ncbi:MucB/RseB C-terminal domain-containing protein [Gynuella sunshinyii]|uniref:Negative regulator of sigma E activity n=1 Tax=Gynuella sunshinyii YC6258 TaxID=1445510 RepID=A0A0C5VVN8_9GAMM|nr:MucB/RseB C-terminal domain-containing protein [Gynuella sunshinyii]AJQ94534.1 negative regulator of sigma E activity [Gynuella sunshinyii YC6258]
MKTALVVVVFVCVSMLAWGKQVDGERWLDDMISANRNLNYQGSFIYVRGSDVQTLKINHRIHNHKIQEKIWNINGEHMEVIRLGDVQQCWHEKDSKIPLSHTLPAGPYSYLFTHHMGEMLENYVVTVEGQERIAEHDAWHISVTPKDDYRFGYRFWLERDTKLLLRSELVGKDGMPLDQFQYVSVAINPSFHDSDFSPTIRDGFSHQAFVTRQPDAVPNINSGMWVLKWLPKGFLLRNADSQTLESTKVDRLLYTDGMSSFTIYAELASAGMPEQKRHFGATIAATVKKGDYMLTLVGEIPMETAMMILDNIQLKS